MPAFDPAQCDESRRHEDDAERGCFMRAGGQRPNAEFSLYASMNRTKGSVCCGAVGCMMEYAVNDTNVRHLEIGRAIRNRSVATARVPAKHSPSGQAQTLEMLRSLREAKLRRISRQDCGSTACFQHVCGTSQIMGKGLTIIAKTNNALGPRFQ